MTDLRIAPLAGGEAFRRRSHGRSAVVLAALLFSGSLGAQQPASPSAEPTADDHRDMMQQLGIKALRPGPSGNEQAPNAANYDEAKANPYPNLPPLLTLERALFRLIAVGFLLLSLALASGVLYSEQLFGRAFQFTHKNVFAVASWVVFGALVVGRWGYGWRGRQALRWILAGTVLLLLAYLGSKFVLEVILGR